MNMFCSTLFSVCMYPAGLNPSLDYLNFFPRSTWSSTQQTHLTCWFCVFKHSIFEFLKLFISEETRLHTFIYIQNIYLEFKTPVLQITLMTFRIFVEFCEISQFISPVIHLCLVVYTPTFTIYEIIDFNSKHSFTKLDFLNTMH